MRAICGIAFLGLALNLYASAAINPFAGSKTVLGIDGPQFTVNGKPTFLLGVSYYGALGASDETIRSDLSAMKRRGINWIRVWATWAAFGNDVSAVDAEGNPRPSQVKRLEWLVKECDRSRMIVDVTLSRGNGITGSPRLQGLKPHQSAVEAVSKALKPFTNWYLDLSNERNIADKRFTSFEDLHQLLAAAKETNPEILVTASHAGDMGRDDLRRYISEVRVDFISPHRPRTPESAGQTEAKTQNYLEWMRDLGRVVPVHYQEPFRRGFGGFEPESADFLTDLQGAVRGSAAGWCLHNGDNRSREDGLPRRSFDLRAGPLFDLIDPVETEVISNMASTLKSASAQASKTVR